MEEKTNGMEETYRNPALEEAARERIRLQVWKDRQRGLLRSNEEYEEAAAGAVVERLCDPIMWALGNVPDPTPLESLYSDLPGGRCRVRKADGEIWEIELPNHTWYAWQINWMRAKGGDASFRASYSKPLRGTVGSGQAVTAGVLLEADRMVPYIQRYVPKIVSRMLTGNTVKKINRITAKGLAEDALGKLGMPYACELLDRSMRVTLYPGNGRKATFIIRYEDMQVKIPQIAEAAGAVAFLSENFRDMTVSRVKDKERVPEEGTVR